MKVLKVVLGNNVMEDAEGKANNGQGLVPDYPILVGVASIYDVIFSIFVTNLHSSFLLFY